MPIYEFKCKKCGEILEVFQRYDDAPMEICPSCFGRLEKIMSKNTFYLKGGGWFSDPPKPPKGKDNDNKSDR